MFEEVHARFDECFDGGPAADCDLDHTIPHADGGPTHASKVRLLCRFDHSRRQKGW